LTNFQQVGIGSDFTSNVLTVDGSSYTVNQLPVSLPWSLGTPHNFSWASPLAVNEGKRYIWSSTSGLSTERSGTFIATSGTDTMIANYITQYYVRIQASSGGSVVQSSDWYSTSSTMAISATPSAGYKFSQWTVSGSASVADAASKDTTVTVNGPGDITASFAIATTTAPPTTQSSNGGLIIGIIVALVAVLIIFFVLVRRRRSREQS
jgi:hypothetical protein